MDQFILFGDSITQQSFSQDEGEISPGTFGPALTNAYVRRLDIINRGLSGYNTRQALRVLPQIIPSPQQARIRFLTIFFGANDARLPDTPPAFPQQHVPLLEFRENLMAIITHPCIQEHKGIRIMLITPPPVDERKQMRADQAKYPSYNQPMFRRSAVVTARYAQVVRDLGAELELAVLDIWTAIMERAGYEGHHGFLESDQAIPGSKDAPENERLQALLLDGLHFSRSAYELLFEELMSKIARTWPDQMPEALPFVLPRWDDEEEAWKNNERNLS